MGYLIYKNLFYVFKIFKENILRTYVNMDIVRLPTDNFAEALLGIVFYRLNYLHSKLKINAITIHYPVL